MPVGIARDAPAVHRLGWLAIGLRPTGVRRVAQQRHGPKRLEVGLPSARQSQCSAYGGGLSVEVLIGVDPHKSVNAVAAIDEYGEMVGNEVSRPTGMACERWSG